MLDVPVRWGLVNTAWGLWRRLKMRGMSGGPRIIDLVVGNGKRERSHERR